MHGFAQCRGVGACLVEQAGDQAVGLVEESEQQVLSIDLGLSEADREVLLMRLVDELPYQEIGYILDLEPAAARQAAAAIRRA